MASGIAETTRIVASHASDVFGGNRRGDRYYDPTESRRVDLLRCDDAPKVGYTSYSTVDLHLFENKIDEDDIRIEFAGVCATKVEEFSNLLTTAAFFVIKNHWRAAPGIVFPDIVTEYDLGTTMRHVLWMPPTPWDGLHTLAVTPSLEVRWLLAIPIYESEREFLLEHGLFKLDDIFSEHEIPYYDLQRPAVV